MARHGVPGHLSITLFSLWQLRGKEEMLVLFGKNLTGSQILLPSTKRDEENQRTLPEEPLSKRI